MGPWSDMRWGHDKWYLVSRFRILRNINARISALVYLSSFITAFFPNIVLLKLLAAKDWLEFQQLSCSKLFRSVRVPAIVPSKPVKAICLSKTACSCKIKGCTIINKYGLCFILRTACFTQRSVARQSMAWSHKYDTPFVSSIPGDTNLG